MLGKIFNRGKKNEFYLEINEAEGTSSTVEKTKGKVATATEVEKVTESAPSPEATVEAVEAKTVSKPTKAKASKKTQKDKKTSTSTKKESGSKPADPAYSGASSWEQPFWVKAMYKNASSDSSQSTETGTQPTFAPNYLMGQSSSRRCPGPSLNKFKDMARQKKF